MVPWTRRHRTTETGLITTTTPDFPENGHILHISLTRWGVRVDCGSWWLQPGPYGATVVPRMRPHVRVRNADVS